MKYILLCDGSSDSCLIPLIDRLILEEFNTSVSGKYGDLRFLQKSPKTLKERVDAVFQNYTFDFLIIHRDAEKEQPDTRKQEIAVVLEEYHIAFVPIVPIRMTESWLLVDEHAIRCAARNPNGSVELSLPVAKNIEQLPNPKKELEDAIKKASELKSRSLKKLRPRKNFHLIAEYMVSLDQLKMLSSVQDFITSVRDANFLTADNDNQPVDQGPVQ